MDKIIAIIPCYNEEIHIHDAIVSVLWADEIVVVDSFSNDRTVEIINECIEKYKKIKLYQHIYENSTSQKNWILNQVRSEWIFLLDADERCTSELSEEIKTIIAQKEENEAFWIGRQNFFMGRELKFIWKSDKVIRLFKSHCRYENKHVHGEIITNTKAPKLKNKILHYTYKDINRHLLKSHKYCTWGAYDRLNTATPINCYHLVILPIFIFIKFYIIKLGILDGIPGLFISAHAAWNRFERYMKIWLIRRGEQIKK